MNALLYIIASVFVVSFVAMLTLAYVAIFKHSGELAGAAYLTLIVTIVFGAATGFLVESRAS